MAERLWEVENETPDRTDRSTNDVVDLLGVRFVLFVVQ